jgi:hypothetical protein
MNDTATFELFVRRLPGSRRFLVAAGLELVCAVLSEVGRVPIDLLVIGKREPPGPHTQHGAMGGVGFRIAYHAPTDVLVLSS